MADKIESRLAQVAQDNGFGAEQMAQLREAYGQFRSDLGRITNEMQPSAIGATVQTAIAELSDGARTLLADEVPAQADASADRAQVLERLQSVQETTSTRISLIAQGLDFDGVQALRGVQSSLDASFASLSEGVQSGALTIDDVRAGVQSALLSAGEGARTALAGEQTSGSQATSGGAANDAQATAAASGLSESERVAGFREGIEARIANFASSLGFEDAKLEGVVGVGRTFDALMDRVEKAFFTAGSEPLSKLGDALSNVVGILRDELGSVMAEEPPVSLYDPNSGLDPLQSERRDASVDYMI